MNKVHARISDFFKDKTGNWAIIAFPNVLLTAWVVTMILTKFMYGSALHDSLSSLASAILFAWAYLELTEGTSYFRRVLGAIILAVVIIGFLVP